MKRATLPKRANPRLGKLYAADETAWLERSAQLIKEKRFEQLDYLHLSEYLDDMAQRDRREVESRLIVLIAHLLKWRHQPDSRSRSWKRTILDQRMELALLFQSKTLRNHALKTMETVYERARRRAAQDMDVEVRTLPSACSWSLDDTLAEDFPE